MKLSVWEVAFHPSSPDSLFTCSEDGAVRRMDLTREIHNLSEAPNASVPPVDVVELLKSGGAAVNSLSISGSTLVCGTDSESLFVIENIL